MDAARYQSSVRAYREGRDDEALAGIAALLAAREPGKPTDRALFDRLDPQLAPAAIVLHLDASLRALIARDVPTGGTHLRVGERLVQTPAIADGTTPAIRAIRRGWYVFAAWAWTATADRSAAGAHLHGALSRYPDDPDLLLARGSLAERETVLAGIPLTAKDVTVRPPRAVLSPSEQRALIDFERVVARDPARAEASVRAGRLYLRAGLVGKARTALQRATGALERLEQGPRAEERRIEYLAHVFLGAAAAHADEWPAAAVEYQRATRLCPGAPTAQLAESHAMLMIGNTVEARTALSIGTGPRAAADPTCGADPWVDYCVGQFWRLPALLRELAKVARE